MTDGLDAGCLWPYKGTKNLANHNGAGVQFAVTGDVCDLTKVQKI